ncbi:hypothetical protein NPIL_473271 [Nephila pilipes]|uniref:Uncharacterized protein n=1 Tax=Nephila pilipes TaxID=299642 RepID=A0A8X6PSE8_NEPPI|nr:hypothetical protein NPIL_473271 [Nephila pilipes]
MYLQKCSNSSHTPSEAPQCFETAKISFETKNKTPCSFSPTPFASLRHHYAADENGKLNFSTVSSFEAATRISHTELKQSFPAPLIMLSHSVDELNDYRQKPFPLTQNSTSGYLQK